MNELGDRAIQIHARGKRGKHNRLWREWCFARVLLRHFRWRFLLMVLILLAGGLLFQKFEPEKHHTLPRATYYTWSLVFGEPPEEFPQSRVLQAMFFIVPVLGITIIIEGIVDLALTIGDRRRNERSWCAMMASAMSDHIVLVGLGRLGYRTYTVLRNLGEPVVVIEAKADNQFLEDVRRDGVPIFVSDARRERVLDDANIKKARSIIVATDDDLANLEIALDARRLAPDIRVVLRMFDQHMADKVEGAFDIHIAMSQSNLSAPAFATAAVEPSIVGSIVVDGRLLATQRWRISEDGPFCGKTVGDLVVSEGVSVIERRARDEAGKLFPPPDTLLSSGDEILVQGAFERLQQLSKRRTQETARVGGGATA